jgi:DNA polymerase III subunit delta'
MPPKKAQVAKNGATQVPLLAAPLLGRADERARMVSALRDARLPRVLLLSGAEGIGKQRMALWTARLLLCGSPSPEGPCESCADCRLSADLAHPDLHVYLPHAPLGGGAPEAQRDASEAARAEALEARRGNALYPPVEPGAAYQVATARALRARAGARPYRPGGRQVFVLAEAHLLTPRDGAHEAANTLLKTLEEPPEGAHFLLTSSAGERVLPTIRSRCVEMRLAPLGETEVRDILLAGGVEADPAVRAAAASGGSVAEALRWMDDAWQETRVRAIALLAAALEDDQAARVDVVAGLDFKNARGGFQGMLAHVERLAHQAVVLRAGTDGEACAVDPRLRALPGISTTDPVAWARVAHAAAEARRLAERNATPFLVLGRLLRRTRAALKPEA